MDHPTRKHVRLKTFDYAAGGTFCVTICTLNRKNIFGHVKDGEEAKVCLSPLGGYVQRLIESIPDVYPGVLIHNSVVMPNHVHLLIQIPHERPTSLYTIIRSLKTLATKKYGQPIWQRSFFEHVVRNEAEALRYWKYIDENPKKWTLDPYFCDKG